MSTGVKLLIGCVGLAVLGLVLMAVAVGVGGFALKRGVESVLGGVDEHRDASQMLARVEREHPFQPPGDGVVSEEQIRRFLAVTDAAWQEMEPWSEDLRRLRDRADASTRPGLGDMVAGARAVGGIGQARLALADALADHDTSLGEYAWVGLTLARAAEASEGGRQRTDDIPEANLRLVERHGESIPRFDDGEGRPGPGLVLAMATLWGMSEVSTWSALGLDTLLRGR